MFFPHTFLPTAALRGPRVFLALDIGPHGPKQAPKSTLRYTFEAAKRKLIRARAGARDIRAPASKQAPKQRGPHKGGKGGKGEGGKGKGGKSTMHAHSMHTYTVEEKVANSWQLPHSRRRKSLESI